MSDDAIDRFAVALDPSTEYARSAEIGSAAQKALFKHADHEAIQRVARARSRLDSKYDFREGMVVYVWQCTCLYIELHVLIHRYRERQSSMYVRRHIYIYTHTLTYTCTCARAYAYTYTCTNVHL